MKRKVNMEYEFITDTGNCFVIRTYKCNGYCCDIFKQSNIDGKTLTFFHSSRNDNKSIFFMTVNNWEYYLDNNY